MIAGCPKCGARYRVEAGKLGPEGARLRCSQCQAVFRVTPPVEAAPAASAALERPAQPPEPQGPRLRVLVADPDVASGKTTAHALTGWGYESLLVHDGVEAILSIQRSLPDVAVVDAALPKMFGFQVCELVKRNEQLRTIRVVLVGAIHAEERYRRAPSELYGADAYVERPQLPEALRPILRGLVPGPGAAATAAPAPPAAAAPVVAPAPARDGVAPAPAAAPAAAAPAAPRSEAARPAPRPAPAAQRPVPAPDPAPSPDVAAAERLARIVVSDIVLYNPEKFAAGVRDGNVLDVLSAEVAEGRGLFEQRVDPKLREKRDFLAEELVRVARARGMN